jgi:NAD(P)-dependent dehydrogenase (short-subunit alcohol dehydrogenase family)
MKGKTVLITGAARGMGKVTARALAAKGANLILVDWEGEEGTRTRDLINAECGRQAAEFIYCDLSSMAQVRQLADTVKQRHQALHVLINNAGITDPVRRLSEDGREMHLATCHLAHFLLTLELLDLIKASAPARIICISSDAHKAGPGLDFDDFNNEALWKGKAVNNNAAFQAYHRAKLCNLYFARSLAKRLEGSDVSVNAVSPGYFVNTTIHRQLTGIFAFGAKIVFGMGTLFGLNTPEKGARSHIYLASSPEVEGVSGLYFEHCKEKDTSDLSKDEAIAEQLWQLSADMVDLNSKAA